jgi:hypothetical protein
MIASSLTSWVKLNSSQVSFKEVSLSTDRG